MKLIRITIAVIAVVSITNFPARCQSKPNSFYLELLGNGFLYSVNYDRFFTVNFGARFGISYLSFEEESMISNSNMTIMPITVNYFIGNGNSKLELGGGFTFISNRKKEHSGSNNFKAYGTATIGYRYQQSDGGFLFRVGFTPFFSMEGVVPYCGISLGTSF